MNQRQAGGMGDELTNAALIGLIGMFGIALGGVWRDVEGTPEASRSAAAWLLYPPRPHEDGTRRSEAHRRPAARCAMHRPARFALAQGASFLPHLRTLQIDWI